jgi:D-glycero-alpha-D-manno-heptose 1-phosphate guanylyltransferase
MSSKTEKGKMQAVIMAGGYGTRLDSLTRDLPKPMVPVKGKPFLEHLLNLLKSWEITKILLCTGYLSQKIEDYFGDGSGFGLDITYSVEDRLTGTGGALKLAESHLAPEFLLVNGDTYLSIDYDNFIARFKQGNKMGIVAAYDNRLKKFKANIALNQDKNVAAYSKNQVIPSMRYTDAGVQIFRKDVLKLIPRDTVISLENDIFPRLINRGELGAYVTSERFYDIGTPDELKTFEEALQKQWISLPSRSFP